MKHWCFEVRLAVTRIQFICANALPSVKDFLTNPCRFPLFFPMKISNSTLIPSQSKAERMFLFKRHVQGCDTQSLPKPQLIHCQAFGGNLKWLAAFKGPFPLARFRARDGVDLQMDAIAP
jgi:hypothetical protein